MSLRSEFRLTVFVQAGLSLLLVLSVCRAGDVSTYLERLGLDELRAAHLEQRIEEEGGAARERLAEQLAQVYGKLLELASDPQRRAELEARLVRVLEGPLAGASPELRLPLLRSRYRMVEDAAERYRVALDEPGEIDRARAMLSDIAAELAELESLVTRRAETLRNRLNRASTSELAMVRLEMERANDRQAQITFTLAWADYYRLVLDGNPDYGRAAERRFARLLSLEPSELLPENVSVELRGEEAIARCILGIALVRARMRSPASAVPWLELLDTTEAWGPLRERLPAWRLVVLIEGGDAAEALRILRNLERENDAIEVAVLRMGAIIGVRSSVTDPDAELLRAWCIQRLAVEGEFGQLHDLAMRFGLERMGTGIGFAVRYVTGIVRLHEGRSMDDPGSDQAARRFRAAVEAFDAAITSSDADRFPEAVTECIRLKAIAQLELGEYRPAGESFVKAASRLSGNRAADAHVAAVNAFERLVDADREDSSARNRMNDLVDRFAARFPHDARTVVMRMRRALRAETPRIEDVEELLRISPEAPAAAEARRVAADLMFRIYRAERDPQTRAAFAGRFLDLAVPIQQEMVRTLDAHDDGDVTLYSQFSRRILEVSLLPGMEQPGIARSVLDELESVMHVRPDRFVEIEGEVHYRRLRERLSSGAVNGAMQAAARIRAADAQSSWSRAADQAMFVYADRTWRELRQSDGDDRLVIELMRDFGARYADFRYELDPKLASVETIAVMARVAEAELVRMLRSDDHEVGERARERLEPLLEKRPRDAGLLRLRAQLAEAMDEPERALDCWRLLVAGLSRGSDAWFEARTGQIRMLAELDHETARQLLGELRVLYPNFGPEPYASQLRALDLSVPGREERGSS